MMKKAVWGCLALCLLLAAAPFVVIGLAALFNSSTPSPTDLNASVLHAQPPDPLPAPITLRVVTFNIQDLWVVGRDRPARMRAIGQRLTELDPDIVGFQESFIEKDRTILIDAMKDSRLKYHQYYPSGTVGSGLLISSAFPIREVLFHRYTVSNPWYKFWEGDWWAGKGLALARIEVQGGYVDLYNTHAQAGYGNPAYRIVRKQQMIELAEFINRTKVDTIPAFLVGDMNCRPGNEDFETAVQGAGLVRAMLIPSSIDHIFKVTNEHYSFEVIKTIEIPRAGLSDHNGYVSDIRIAPEVDSQTSVL